MAERYRIMARVPKGQGDLPEIVLGKTTPNQVYSCNDPDVQWYKDNVPCRNACPAQTRIPEYIDASARGDYEKSYEINLTDNVLPHVLGRVCAHPCESACRHGFEGMGEPVSICWLKRSGADLKTKSPKVSVAPSTGKKVAVIGSGPAGLTVAFDMAKWGHKVTIFEGYPKAGGMLTYGIPKFRLPEDVVAEEIDRILDLGVILKTGRWVGKDITLEELAKDFDAVVMAAGNSSPLKLNIPGEDAKGVSHGLDFMGKVNKGETASVGETVVVLGGGYTAMDCARSAYRLGAKKVMVVYRRSRNEFKVDEREMRETAMEGIEFEYLLSPKEILKGSDGAVHAVVFARMRLGEPGKDGRRSVVEIPNSTTTIKCDQVLAAIGQSAESPFGGDFTIGDDFATQIKKVFATGDYVTGPRDIISAVGLAHKTARSVDKFLTGKNRHGEAVRETVYPQTERGSYAQWKSINGNFFDLLPRQDMFALDLSSRKDQNIEVDLGYNEEETHLQGERCYLCNHNVMIDGASCILCFNCVDVCPYNCILMLQENFVKVKNGAGYEHEKQGSTYMIMDEKDCVRCGLCIDACPVPCMTMNKTEVENTFT
ncbi:MAG: FAD-dependent oxidoreductase [Nitrospinae bacterium]|nr:FAD-dependent oxidoreductase [Nitrospinota bacterium]